MFDNPFLALARLAWAALAGAFWAFVAHAMTAQDKPGGRRWVSVTGTLLWGLVLGLLLGLLSLLVWPMPWLPSRVPGGVGVLLAALAGAGALCSLVGGWRVRQGLPRQVPVLAVQGALLGLAGAGARWVAAS